MIFIDLFFFQTKINIHGIYNTLTYHKRHSVDVKLASRQTESYRKKKAKRQFVKDDYCLFLSNQYKVKSCAWKFFNKNIKLVDFTKPEETVKTMNEWVSNQTGNTDVSLDTNYFDNYTHILFVSDERCYIIYILWIFIMFLKNNKKRGCDSLSKMVVRFRIVCFYFRVSKGLVVILVEVILFIWNEVLNWFWVGFKTTNISTIGAIICKTYSYTTLFYNVQLVLWKIYKKHLAAIFSGEIRTGFRYPINFDYVLNKDNKTLNYV